MEQQQILSTERERIGRELHDGAIQKVYAAGLLVDSARNLVEPDHPVLITRLEKSANMLNDAIIDLRESLAELYIKPGGVPFTEALESLANDPHFHSLVDIRLNLDLPSEETLSPVRTQHVLAVVNEALSNIIRHARAQEVKITAQSTDGRLVLNIIDDGVSIPKNYTAGYGLRNMRDRARLLGGELEIKPGDGKGTHIRLNIPWKDERS
jgi:signal transduction histidine kinase